MTADPSWGCPAAESGNWYVFVSYIYKDQPAHDSMVS